MQIFRNRFDFYFYHTGIRDDMKCRTHEVSYLLGWLQEILPTSTFYKLANSQTYVVVLYIQTSTNKWVGVKQSKALKHLCISKCHNIYSVANCQGQIEAVPCLTWEKMWTPKFHVTLRILLFTFQLSLCNHQWHSWVTTSCQHTKQSQRSTAAMAIAAQWTNTGMPVHHSGTWALCKKILLGKGW